MRVPEFGAGLRNLLLLSVLFCSAFSSFADVVLTDGEYNELMLRLESLEEIQKEREQIYSERQEELNQREEELTQREADLSERVSDLKERENSMSVKERQLELLETSLKEQKQEQRKDRIENMLEKVLWGTCGFFIGSYVR